MKWMIASDIHGSAYYCRKLLEAYTEEGADRLLLLGDILYHGPRNDLPRDYAPKEVIALLNERKNDIYCVRGNCDTEVDQMVLEFPLMNTYEMIETDGLVLFATHGHVYNPSSPPPFVAFDVMLNGHTHISALQNLEEFYYANPGSVSIPKGGTQNSYMTYEDRCFVLHRLSDGAETERMQVEKKK